MKILLSLFLIISIIVVPPSLEAQSNKEEYSAAINLAGKQRMLIQKMVKEALLIYSGIDIEENRDNLRQTVGLFVETLNGLANGDSYLNLAPAKSGTIRAQIDRVMSMYKEIAFIFNRINKGQAPSQDAVLELAEKEPLLLENMDMAVRMYEEEARNIMRDEKAFLGIEINLAGKQRMLTQKMAKEALLIYLDIDRRKNKKLLNETSILFDKTLKGLKYGDGDLGLPGTKEKRIIDQIDSVVRIWSELKPAIDRSSDIMVDKISREQLQAITRLNLILLEEMDRIVKMYEELSKKGNGGEPIQDK